MGVRYNVLFCIKIFAATLCLLAHSATPSRAEEDAKLSVDLRACKALRDAAAYRGNEQMKFLTVGDEGFLFRDVDVATEFKVKSDALHSLRQMTEMLARKGTSLVILIVPPKGLIERDALGKRYEADKVLSAYNKIVQELTAAGAVVVDPLEEMDSAAFYRRDFHWTQTGAEQAADEAARVIRKLPQYGSIPEAKFKTTHAEAEPFLGRYAEFAARVCGLTIPGEPRRKYVTTRTDQDAFSDAEKPQIALFGTSFSAEDNHFNFVGFLREKLSRDIENYAMDAGGVDSSLLGYFSRRQPGAEDLPKVMLWEILTHQAFLGNTDLSAIFRQIIPQLAGGCRKDAVLVSGEGENAISPQYLLGDLEPAHIMGKDHFVQLDVTDKNNRTLRLNVLYADGTLEVVDFTRQDPEGMTGTFYYQLNDRLNAPVIRMAVETNRPGGRITTRICRK